MRTEALIKSLEVNAVDDATLIGLLVLALNARNVSIQTQGSGLATRTKLVQSITEGGRLSQDVERMRVVARQMLANVLSCSLGHGDSGLHARIAGDAIGADAHLGNMATEDFLSCLSKTAIERVGSSLHVQPRQRVKDTRAAVIAEAPARPTSTPQLCSPSPKPRSLTTRKPRATIRGLTATTTTDRTKRARKRVKPLARLSRSRTTISTT